MINYKTLDRFPGYRFCEDGTIWTCKQNNEWRKMKTPIDTTGYYRMCLRDKDRKKRCVHVHAMILESFVGPRPIGYVCCHKDGNKRNNHISNLRWDTHKGNRSDDVHNGTRIRGERHHLSKYSDELVSAIRNKAKSGIAYSDIARETGIRPSYVRDLVLRKERCYS